MTDPLIRFGALRRPRLLIRAARLGLEDYRRDRDLQRILQTNRAPATRHAVDALFREEERLEEFRNLYNASYDVGRHVEVLIALIAEVRLLTPASATIG